jgi:homoserine kinase type II
VEAQDGIGIDVLTRQSARHAAELSSLWPLGGWLETTELSGHRDDHLRIVAGDGVFYARRSHAGKCRSELTAQLNLRWLLHRRGLPVPVSVPNVEGSRHAVVHERLWVVTEEVPGAAYDGSDEHVRALATMLATYHQKVADLITAAAEPQTLLELRWRSDIEEADLYLRARGQRVAERLAAMLPALPRVIVHGSPGPSCVLFDGADVVGLLGFDDAHPDVRALDLAIAMYDVAAMDARGVGLDLDKMATFLSAYCAVEPLHRAELAAVPLLMEVRHLVRLLTLAEKVRVDSTGSVEDHVELGLERRRLQWLDLHRDRLAEACTP